MQTFNRNTYLLYLFHSCIMMRAICSKTKICFLQLKYESIDKHVQSDSKSITFYQVFTFVLTFLFPNCEMAWAVLRVIHAVVLIHMIHRLTDTQINCSYLYLHDCHIHIYIYSYLQQFILNIKSFRHCISFFLACWFQFQFARHKVNWFCRNLFRVISFVVPFLKMIISGAEWIKTIFFGS